MKKNKDNNGAAPDNKKNQKNTNSVNLDTIAFQIRESYKAARTNIV